MKRIGMRSYKIDAPLPVLIVLMISIFFCITNVLWYFAEGPELNIAHLGGMVIYKSHKYDN